MNRQQKVWELDVSRYKALAFAVSAAIGGLGGGFVAQFQVNISAPFFEFWESILILCMVVLGGMGSIRGAMIGAAILGSLGEVLRPGAIIPYQFGGARYLIFGTYSYPLNAFPSRWINAQKSVISDT